jgi:methylmalonyl-CoA mutase
MESKEKTVEKLFSEFPPVSTPEWGKIIEKDLKGADYEKKLVWRTNEGFNVKPYYRAEDLEGLNHLETFPGEFPYTRGNKTDNNNWLIRQDIIVEDVKEANKKALFVLNRGIESLGFIFTEVPSAKQMHTLLDQIVPEAIEINLVCGSHFEEILKKFIAVLSEKGCNLDEIKGSITYNPLTEMALTGTFANFKEGKTLIELGRDLPKFRTLVVHGSIFHNSGSSAVEELGFSLATAAEYLYKFTEAGISIDELAPKMRFDFAVGGNYFMEIAKIRAARILWSKMVEAYNPTDKSVAQMFVHSTTSNWNKTVYDPYVNMLRTTTEAMSSVIGGTDSSTINAFDESYETPSEFGERIARNQQLLLKEESYMNKVADPAAGSYYIETLTASIAEEAWKIFLATEEKGGFTEAMKKGFVQETINATAQKRDQDIAMRKEIFVGTNQFPNFTEKMELDLGEEIFEATDFTSKKAKIETLKPYRGAQAFEALRYKTDLFAKENKRPLAFMLTYGNVAMRKARASFASNFFACAGFEVQDNNGYKSAEGGVEAAKAAHAEIIVICSSDEEYTELAPAVKELSGEAIVVIAGYSKAIMDDLKAKGIKHFIHVKSNVLETLKQFQTELGIK